MNDIKVNREDTTAAERTSPMETDDWKQASPAERKLALRIYASLKEDDPTSFIQGRPATALSTAIDGRFNLVLVSRKIIQSMHEAHLLDVSTVSTHGESEMNDKITDEMIRVGAEVLMEQMDVGPYSARRIAEEVFMVMREMQEAELARQRPGVEPMEDMG